MGWYGDIVTRAFAVFIGTILTVVFVVGFVLGAWVF